MKHCFLLLLSLFFAGSADHAQLVEDPTTWTYEVKKRGEGKYDLIWRVALKPGWHIWSQNPGGDGLQIPPTFSVDKNAAIKTAGAVKESGAGKHTGEMEGVEGEVVYYDGEVQYVQAILVEGGIVVTGMHEYQVCNDRMCLPPKRKSFVFKIEP